MEVLNLLLDESYIYIDFLKQQSECICVTSLFYNINAFKKHMWRKNGYHHWVRMTASLPWTYHVLATSFQYVQYFDLIYMLNFHSFETINVSNHCERGLKSNCAEGLNQLSVIM